MSPHAEGKAWYPLRAPFRCGHPPLSYCASNKWSIPASVALRCCAVVPSVQWQRSTFEGFDVIAYVPERPRGMAYLFHGTGGSAAFAVKRSCFSTA